MDISTTTHELVLQLTNCSTCCTTAGMELNSTQGVYHCNGDKKKEANGSTTIDVDVEIGHKNRQPDLVGAVGPEKTIFEQPESSGICFLVLRSTSSSFV